MPESFNNPCISMRMTECDTIMIPSSNSSAIKNSKLRYVLFLESTLKFSNLIDSITATVGTLNHDVVAPGRAEILTFINDA